MDLRAMAMGLTFALIWSSAFTSARIIVADASPLFSLALRFLISGVLGVMIARAMGQSWHLTRNQWRATILFGICQNALYLGLNFCAMQTVEASVAAIIASTMPLLVALAGWLIFRRKSAPAGRIGSVRRREGSCRRQRSVPVPPAPGLLQILSLAFAGQPTWLLRPSCGWLNFVGLSPLAPEHVQSTSAQGRVSRSSARSRSRQSGASAKSRSVTSIMAGDACVMIASRGGHPAPRLTLSGHLARISGNRN